MTRSLLTIYLTTAHFTSHLMLQALFALGVFGLFWPDPMVGMVGSIEKRNHGLGRFFKVVLSQHQEMYAHPL